MQDWISDEFFAIYTSIILVKLAKDSVVILTTFWKLLPLPFLFFLHKYFDCKTACLTVDGKIPKITSSSLAFCVVNKFIRDFTDI